ncbi:LOG family protein [Actinospongicola halichondriae]|uniref:LOG family protein n=1 Tax=Actinospongicola halichondriae TaxID=3236844 RepID=UPI003D58FCF7
MIPVPERMYTRHDLFDGWEPEIVGSWADTLDGATYLEATLHGLRAPDSAEVATGRSLHDTAMTRFLHDRLWAQGCRPTALMGGHAAERGSPTYRAAADIAAGLSRRGLTVLTGGGPGAMEAGHLGARLALSTVDIGEAIDDISADVDARTFPLGVNELVVGGGFEPEALAQLHRWQIPAFRLADQTAAVANDTVGIPTWHYGHEPPTPLATHHAKYFENSIREDGLLALAVNGIVFLPGSAGTLQEIFQDAAQNHYRSVRRTFSPMVFLDLDGHWSRTFPIRPVLEALFREEDRAMVCWTADLDEAVEFVDRFVIPDA